MLTRRMPPAATSHPSVATLRLWLVALLALAQACTSDAKGPAPARPAADLDAGGAQEAEAGPPVPDAGLPVPDAAQDAQAPVECTVVAPTSCPSPATRYGDVEPVIKARCTGCHNGSDERWPLTSYQHVADWYAEIRGQMLACSMPPPSSGMTMPNSERELLLQWIRCGYPR